MIFDENFALQGKATFSFGLEVPRPQWAQQDPDRVLSGVLRVMRQCLKKTGMVPHDLLGIGLSGVLYSLLAIDSKGRPLLPLIQWSDNRAEEESSRLDQAFQAADLYWKTGCRNNAMYLPAKILWIKENLPDLYARAAKFISIKDYVAQHLTGGDYTTDYIVASASGLFNIHEKRWDRDVLELLGLAEDRLPAAVPPQSLLGTIRREVARKTGFLEGTPVYAGGGDGPLSNVGAGAIEPGHLNLSIGSGGILRIILDQPRLCPLQRTWCYLLKEDRWILGGVNNGGMVLQWFWESFWGKEARRKEKGKGRFALLDEWAKSVPPGSEGLVFLPYLTGERSPNWRTEARASFFGIHSRHHRGHFTRSVMEGLGFQMQRVFTAMEEISGGVEEIRFTGGFTRSLLWSQMMCDILGRVALVPRVEESSALGAAAMAALGMGVVPDLLAVKEKVEIERVLHPDWECHRRYEELCGLFADLYQDSVEGWRRLRRITEAEEKE